MLKNFLEQNKSEIIKRWFDSIIETYPENSHDFFKRDKNQFGNPVGYTISKETESLYGVLLDGINNDEKLYLALDNIIKIRTVQDYSPSQAINFVYLLKRVIRDFAAEHIHEENIYNELLEFESRIDKLALCSFDVYMRCKEKIYQIRLNESRRKVAKLLEKVNLNSGNPEQLEE
ncbi:MAG: RsbRD N-terminal domain-containing protein [candidate division Zixibacteria bacterium]|nr:RsbRD N-terminal domain-containing protein [candidate division Zixibacteria bacterium]